MTDAAGTLHFRQGFTYRVTFTWTDEDDVPISLAGMKVTFRLFKEAGRFPAILSLDSAGSQVVVEPGSVTGSVSVTLTAAQTLAFDRGLVYAVSATPTAGTEPVEYVASGDVEVIRMGAH